MKRRNFLKISTGSVLGAPFVFSRRSLLYAQDNVSPLAIVENPDASALVTGNADNTEFVSYSVNSEIIAGMVDSAVMRLSGIPDVGKAWESFFPQGALSESTKIAIKINISYGWEYDWNDKFCPFGGKAVVVDAMVDGLTRMLDGTFPIENITIFDNKNSVNTADDRNKVAMQGFRTYDGNPYDDQGTGQYRIRFVNKDTEVPNDAPGFTVGPYADWEFSDAAVDQQILPPVYESDFWINLIIPKTHGHHAGITGALKNAYGCISGPNLTHGANNTQLSRVTPYIPDIYKNVIQQTPCVLQFLDGLAGLYDWGPIHGSMFARNVIAASTDPMTMNHYIMEIVNEARVQNGLNELTTSSDPILNADDHLNAPHFEIAAAQPELFGNFNSDLRIMEDPVGIGRKRVVPSLQVPQARLLNLKRFGGGWRQGVLFDGTGRLRRVESAIYDPRGRLVRSLQPIATRQDHAWVEWDGRDDTGRSVSPAVYGWHIRVDGRLLHQSIGLF